MSHGQTEVPPWLLSHGAKNAMTLEACLLVGLEMLPMSERIVLENNHFSTMVDKISLLITPFSHR